MSHTCWYNRKHRKLIPVNSPDKGEVCFKPAKAPKLQKKSSSPSLLPPSLTKEKACKMRMHIFLLFVDLFFLVNFYFSQLSFSFCKNVWICKVSCTDGETEIENMGFHFSDLIGAFNVVYLAITLAK